MQHRILCSPSYSLLEVALEAGESIVSEAGAMAWMSANMQTKTSTRGGMLAGLKRKMLSGESFFQNTYSPEGGRGLIGLTSGSPGDIVAYELEQGELFLEKGAYLASQEGVKCDSKFDGLKGLLNEGMFVLRCTGTGMMFFNAYGDISEVDVNGEYIVDNGYAVAWEPSLSWKITKGKKIRSFLFSDQLLCRFTGTGRLWVQSRSPRTMSNWVYQYRPVKNNN